VVQQIKSITIIRVEAIDWSPPRVALLPLVITQIFPQIFFANTSLSGRHPKIHHMKKQLRGAKQTLEDLVSNSDAPSSTSTEIETLMICKSCKQWALSQKCSGCGVMYYCSRECQVADWPNHKTACQHVNEIVKVFMDLSFQTRKDTRYSIDRLISSGCQMEKGCLYCVDVNPINAVVPKPDKISLKVLERRQLPSLPANFSERINILLMVRPPLDTLGKVAIQYCLFQLPGEKSDQTEKNGT
jgi:hypothetical protein